MQEDSTRYAVPNYLAVEWQLKLRDAAARANGPTQQPVPSSLSSSLGSNAGGEDSVYNNSPSTSQIIDWRVKICQWMYNIVDHYGE